MSVDDVKDGDTIVVWFSCGAASAVALKKTVEKYGDRCVIQAVNNPIKEEDEDNARFLKDVEAWVGIPIERAINKNFPECSAEEVWRKKRYMSGVKGAPCTQELKKKARQQWEAINECDWMVLGFTSEEKHRHQAFILTERNNVLPVLIDEGIDREGCFSILIEAGLLLPRTYYQGWPTGNCPGCVKANSPTYWNFVRVHRPDVFESRAVMSREIGAKLVRVKGKRIYLDELDPFAMGRPLNSMKIECGSFCEESNLVKHLKKTA